MPSIAMIQQLLTAASNGMTHVSHGLLQTMMNGTQDVTFEETSGDMQIGTICIERAPTPDDDEERPSEPEPEKEETQEGQ